MEISLSFFVVFTWIFIVFFKIYIFFLFFTFHFLTFLFIFECNFLRPFFSRFTDVFPQVQNIDVIRRIVSPPLLNDEFEILNLAFITNWNSKCNKPFLILPLSYFLVFFIRNGTNKRASYFFIVIYSEIDFLWIVFLFLYPKSWTFFYPIEMLFDINKCWTLIVKKLKTLLFVEFVQKK